MSSPKRAVAEILRVSKVAGIKVKTLPLHDSHPAPSRLFHYILSLNHNERLYLIHHAVRRHVMLLHLSSAEFGKRHTSALLLSSLIAQLHLALLGSVASVMEKEAGGRLRVAWYNLAL